MDKLPLPFSLSSLREIQLQTGSCDCCVKTEIPAGEAQRHFQMCRFADMTITIDVILHSSLDDQHAVHEQRPAGKMRMS